MAAKRGTLADKLFLLIFTAAAILTTWVAVRYWLITGLSSSTRSVRFLDIAIILSTGLIAIIFLTRWISPSITEFVGPTQTNAVKILLQLTGLALVGLVVFSLLGVNIVSALIGIGFFGIVVGLAAQAVLGNLLSGIMLLASRPFYINDRIALITWQYGKFPPSLVHGWLEPSYTGVVRGITLMYTKIQTDSGALVNIPNGIVTQSMVMNLSHGKQSRIGTQFEVPLQVDPEDLHKRLNMQLSKLTDFKGEEDSYEILDISPTAYLVAVSYKVERHHERDMKTILLNALRTAMISIMKDSK